MTDRVNGLIVTLDKSFRDDDVEYIVNAIKMIKGVLKVEMNLETTQDYFAKEQILREIKNELYKFTDNLK